MRILYTIENNCLMADTALDVHLDDNELVINHSTDMAACVRITYSDRKKAREALLELAKTGFLDATERKATRRW